MTVTATVTHATQATGANDPTKQISKDAWNEEHTVVLEGLGDAAEKNVGTTAGTVAAGDHTHTAAAVGADDSGTAAGLIATHEAASDPHTGYQKESEKGQADGYASLGADGKVPSAQLPAGTGGLTIEDVIDALYPVGAIYTSTLSTNPGTLLGRGTWSAFGAGRVMVGHDSGDADFDTGEETGGAKTKAISAHSGAAVADHSAHTHSVTSNVAVGDHASHTHDYTQIVNHTHAVNITDNGHVHTQASQTATTGSVSSWEHGTIDTSSTAAETLNTGSATTGITATTSNPAGGVATGTTAGPSATLSHSVTNNAVTSGNPSATLTHSVTQPSDHSALNVVQPYIVVFAWKRTA